FRDLVISEFLVSRHNQQFTLISRQPEQCLIQSGTLLLPFKFLIREQIAIDDIEIRLQRLHGMFSEEIRSCIPGDLEHPCVEPAVVTKTLPVFQNSNEHLLNEVFGDCAVSGESAKEAEQRLVMPVKKDTKLSHVSLAHCKHQSFVCGLHSVDPSVKTG